MWAKIRLRRLIEELRWSIFDASPTLERLAQGSLVKRVAKGREYWYHVNPDGSRARARYRGKLSAEQIAKHVATKQELDALRAQMAVLARQVRILEGALREILKEDPDDPSGAGATDPAVGVAEGSASNSPVDGGQVDRGGGQRPKRKSATRQRPLVMVQGLAKSMAVIDVAREWEWDLVDHEKWDWRAPGGRAPRGVIATLPVTHPYVEPLFRSGCHVVRVGVGPHPLDDRAPAVLPDLASVGRMAGTHLYECGYKRVACLGWDVDDPGALVSPMFASFRGCVEARGASCIMLALRSLGSESPESHLSRGERRDRALGDWLCGVPKPLGVIAANDNVAAHIRAVCMRAGLSIPDDIGLVGVGNKTVICEMGPVAMSSVDDALDERVRRAMQVLRGLMDGEPPPAARVMIAPIGVVKRRSTNLLAVDDPTVMRALRFMRDHLERNLSVDDIAQAAGSPRRRLERAFQRQFGWCVGTEMRRRRLEHCCNLLEATDLSIAEVARRSGFFSVSYLDKIFREAFGTTPREWRISAAE